MCRTCPPPGGTLGSTVISNLVSSRPVSNVAGTLGTSRIVLVGPSSSDGWRGGLVMALFDVWPAGGTPRSIVDCRWRLKGREILSILLIAPFGFS